MKKKAYGKPCVEFTLIAPLQIMAGSPQPPDADSKGNSFFMDDMEEEYNNPMTLQNGNLWENEE
jgi:hypothetical protein